jgi:hypothetical protein
MVAQGRYGIIYVSLIQVVQLHNRYNILNRNHKQIVYFSNNSPDKAMIWLVLFTICFDKAYLQLIKSIYFLKPGLDKIKVKVNF